MLLWNLAMKESLLLIPFRNSLVVGCTKRKSGSQIATGIQPMDWHPQFFGAAG
jgi:hypothetical protein